MVTYREAEHDSAPILAQANEVRDNHTRTQWEIREALNAQRASESSLMKAEEHFLSESKTLQQIKDRLTEAVSKHGVVLGNNAFFESSRERQLLATLWYPPAAQRARDDVFVAAIAVHRAFADAAAKPLRHNLGALMNVFTTQTLPTANKQVLLPDLWSSLFLVVPLVSTTFASVNRMLGRLPNETLGWLLVDEAGQAVPQAAVGALMRSRRAVVVGDPVQIEPVVILPDTLTNAICGRFGVDPDQYSAPAASVQTLADAASAVGAEFQTKSGSRIVGAPLLAHRRCSEPMFSISNCIAYSGLMVSAKSRGHSPIREVLGESKWIDVQSASEDKWSQDEGKTVLRLLSQMRQVSIIPDLYIITPFVIVAERLRELVRPSRILEGWIEDDPWRWLQERIGTVHTAQGRESEAVIFVLVPPTPTRLLLAVGREAARIC